MARVFKLPELAQSFGFHQLFTSRGRVEILNLASDRSLSSRTSTCTPSKMQLPSGESELSING
jgi:hypothetical protein